MILLIDGNNAVHRADAVTELTAPNGERISGVYGTLRMIRSLAHKFQPEEIIVAWDGGRSKRRMSLNKEYKTREISKEELEALQVRRQILYRQIEILEGFLSCLGVRSIRVKSTEADDLIYVMRSVLSPSDGQIVIVSTDMDYLQMVGEDTVVDTKVYSPTKDIMFDTAKVFEVYGISPGQIVDMKRMTGDGSDHIKGVKGIGEKTAVAILQEYACLDAALDIGKEALLKKKSTAKLFDHLDILERNRQLVDLSLIDDETTLACLEVFEQMYSLPCSMDASRLMQLLMSYDMKSILTTYAEWSMPFTKLNH